MKKIFKIAIALFISANIYAQSPQKLSYQSVVRNSGGTLVQSSPVGIKISILQGSAAGSLVYSESHTATTNINGLATLEIGGGAVISGNFSLINWGAGPYFVKTETDPAGGTAYSITGTSQLLSVPYALYSEKSGTSAAVNGTVNTISKFTPSGTAIGNSQITDDGTTVSIANKTTISGTDGDITFNDSQASITFTTVSGTSAPMINLFSSGTSNSDRMVIAHSPSYPTWGLQYQDAPDKFNFIGSGTTVLGVDLGNQRVGVGTSSPSAKLDVIGNVKITDGTEGAGKVLKSDVVGLASWQPLVVSSAWKMITAAAIDSTIDGTPLKVGYINAPEITATDLDNATINVYFKISTNFGPYQLPYISDAGGKTNQIAAVIRAGKIIITRHSFMQSGTNMVGLPQSLEYRYTIIRN